MKNINGHIPSVVCHIYIVSIPRSGLCETDICCPSLSPTVLRSKGNCHTKIKMGHAPSQEVANERPEEKDKGNAAFASAQEELNHRVCSLIRYRMVRLSAIRHWTRWKIYQELEPHEYVNYLPIRQELDFGEAFEDPETGAKGKSKVDSKDGQAETKKKLYFISHRWLNPVHPDPEGTQLRRVQCLPPRRPSRPLDPDLSSPGDAGSSARMLKVPVGIDWSAQHDPASNVLIFYDFSSLPQEPRTPDESETFKLGILGLNDILTYMRVVILDDQDYMRRSWCLMEYFISSFHGSLILDENRDSRMHKLQQLSITPNQGVGISRSARAEAEAVRGSRMGDIAMSFFAGSFINSSVTKDTDRRSIEDVFRTFIGNNIRAWKYEPSIGWKPDRLRGDQVVQILRGERVRLIDLPETGMPLLRMPTEIDTIVPQSAYDNERESLEPFWAIIVTLRAAKALARYYLLNDPMAHQEFDMVTKTNR